MAHRFQVGEQVSVREDAQLSDGVERYRGRSGVIDHIAESGELVFYCVEFGGKWDSGYIEGAALEHDHTGG